MRKGRFAVHSAAIGCYCVFVAAGFYYKQSGMLVTQWTASFWTAFPTDHNLCISSTAVCYTNQMQAKRQVNCTSYSLYV